MVDQEHIDDLAAPYALGSLEAHEVEQVIAHIAVCDRCRWTVEEAREVAALLPYAVPVAAPPPGLREQIMAALPRGPVSMPGRRPALLDRRAAWLRPAAVAAAVLAVLLGAQTLRMQEALQTAHQQTLVLAPAATKEAQLMAMVAAPRAMTVALQPTEQESPARGRLFIDQQQARGLLVVQRLPALAEGWIYQVWLADERSQREAGRLRTDGEGAGALELAMPDDFVLYRWLWVTVEPAPGGPAPAGRRVLEATLP